jgi:hypothetical protein
VHKAHAKSSTTVTDKASTLRLTNAAGCVIRSSSKSPSYSALHGCHIDVEFAAMQVLKQWRPPMPAWTISQLACNSCAVSGFDSTKDCGMQSPNLWGVSVTVSERYFEVTLGPRQLYNHFEIKFGVVG